jgi:hypothetical protein
VTVLKIYRLIYTPSLTLGILEILASWHTSVLAPHNFTENKGQFFKDVWNFCLPPVSLPQYFSPCHTNHGGAISTPHFVKLRTHLRCLATDAPNRHPDVAKFKPTALRMAKQ